METQKNLLRRGELEILRFLAKHGPSRPRKMYRARGEERINPNIVSRYLGQGKGTLIRRRYVDFREDPRPPRGFYSLTAKGLLGLAALGDPLGPPRPRTHEKQTTCPNLSRDTMVHIASQLDFCAEEVPLLAGIATQTIRDRYDFEVEPPRVQGAEGWPLHSRLVNATEHLRPLTQWLTELFIEGLDYDPREDPEPLDYARMARLATGVEIPFPPPMWDTSLQQPWDSSETAAIIDTAPHMFFERHIKYGAMHIETLLTRMGLYSSVDRFWDMTVSLDLWRGEIKRLAEGERALREKFSDLRVSWEVGRWGDSSWDEEEIKFWSDEWEELDEAWNRLYQWDKEYGASNLPSVPGAK